MNVYHNFDDIPTLKSPVVTVGSFDGVHLGHKVILNTVAQEADKRGGESVVVTFDPHPRKVLSGRADLLTTFPEKKVIIESCGIDNLIVIPFTKEFSLIGYDDFMKDYIIGKLGAEVLVVGYDHNFGRDKKGNYDSLTQDSNERMPEIIMVGEADAGGEKVNSTKIRRLISDGDLAGAARLLGHPYFAVGPIGPGGTFETADPDKLMPPAGEYKVDLTTGGTAMSAIARIADGTLRISTWNGYVPESERVGVVFRSDDAK